MTDLGDIVDVGGSRTVDTGSRGDIDDEDTASWDDVGTSSSGSSWDGGGGASDPEAGIDDVTDGGPDDPEPSDRHVTGVDTGSRGDIDRDDTAGFDDVGSSEPTGKDVLDDPRPDVDDVVDDATPDDVNVEVEIPGFDMAPDFDAFDGLEDLGGAFGDLGDSLTAQAEATSGVFSDGFDSVSNLGDGFAAAVTEQTRDFSAAVQALAGGIPAAVDAAASDEEEPADDGPSTAMLAGGAALAVGAGLALREVLD